MKNILVIDHGLYLPQALKLGEKAKVWYHLSNADPYPASPKSKIGTGFEEIERIGAYEPYLDKADYVVFFDCYYGERTKWLREMGHKVFGCGMAEEFELDRVLFFDTLDKLSLNIPAVYRADGIDDALDYLKGKKDKWLKTSRYRGDFETYHFIDMNHAESWFDDLKYRIGNRAKDIEILILNPIKSTCEIGYDGFNILGKYPDKGIIGYEVKDKAYIGKVTTEIPAIMKPVMDKIAPYFEKNGCQGHYSNEMRIMDSGRVYFTDPTLRCPSPPGEAMCEMWENYSEAIMEIADKKVPVLKEKGKYLAQLSLHSKWYEEHGLYVEYPDEIAKWVKPNNAMKKKGGCYCVPNDNYGYFADVVAYADSIKEAIGLVLERAEQVIADKCDYDCNVFDKAEEAITSGEKHGIGI
jgi:hypothetical protein